jgi:hypothetical protein
MITNTKIKFIYTSGVYLAQDKIQRCNSTKIINNWAPLKVGNFLSRWATTRFLRTTIFHKFPPVIYTSSDQAPSIADKIKFLTVVIRFLLRGPINPCRKVLSA